MYLFKLAFPGFAATCYSIITSNFSGCHPEKDLLKSIVDFVNLSKSSFSDDKQIITIYRNNSLCKEHIDTSQFQDKFALLSDSANVILTIIKKFQ